jgi:hypothetical protein
LFDIIFKKELCSNAFKVSVVFASTHHCPLPRLLFSVEYSKLNKLAYGLKENSIGPQSFSLVPASISDKIKEQWWHM